MIVYFPSTFSPTLVHHQGRISYKSDVNFVCTLLLCKKKNVYAVAVCSVYFKIVLHTDRAQTPFFSCSTKFVLMKKSCQYIYIYIY